MSARILLAEDHGRLSAMLQAFLESLGHQVVSAADGVAALAALENGGIDLMVLDLKLPGMSGVEVLQRVRRSTRWRGLWCSSPPRIRCWLVKLWVIAT